jgi:hypothetical protein
MGEVSKNLWPDVWFMLVILSSGRLRWKDQEF